MADGELTDKQRNRLLAQMTDDVAALVLRDNTLQAQSLAVTGACGVTLLDAQASFVRYLERQGMLDRQLEFLPSDEEIVTRKAARIGLTTPEHAVLLAYAKIWLFEQLLSSKVPEDPFIATALERYFPAALGSRFREAIYRHPLHREIVATHVCNGMLNRVGSTFVHQLMEETGARPSDVVRAYMMARQIFQLVHIWEEIGALDNEVDDRVQTSMLISLRKLTSRATLWFLRRRIFAEEPEAVISRFADPVESVIVALDSLLGESEFESVGRSAEELTQAGVPAELARRVAGADLAHAALDIVELAQSSARTVVCVADVFFALTAKLHLSWLREQIGLLPSDSHWQALAQAALSDELAELLRSLTGDVLGRNPDIAEPRALIDAWEESVRSPLERVNQVLAEVRAATSPDLAILSVGLRELRNLV
jgi:glutamate dehydrogenase